MKVKNAVWLTADKTKAVPASHPEAAFLLAGKNGNVSAEDAKALGITEDGAPGQKAEKKDTKKKDAEK